jgi:hypothetical protein
VSLKVLAEEGDAAAAIETMSTEFGVVRTDTISDFKFLDVFSDSSNLSHSLMSRNQGKLHNQQLLHSYRRGIWGTLAMNSPSWICKSVPQTPHAPTTHQHRSKLVVVPLMRTSPSRTTGRGTCTTECFLGSEYKSAFIVLGRDISIQSNPIQSYNPFSTFVFTFGLLLYLASGKDSLGIEDGK